MPNQGGSHEQHVKSGQQSHKKTDQKNASGRMDDRQQSSGARGGSYDQQSKAGQQSHKNS